MWGVILRTLAMVGGAVTSVPAVVIAAPASGSGKTTVATGLIGALRRAGHNVAPFKVGPDFIDPGYHGLAAGRPGRNLDPVLVGEQLIGPLYAHGADGADIAVVEGVMGLFDGRIGLAATAPAAGSTAHVAALLGAPVILVVDARGQSHSIAALLHGFSTFDTATRVAGVILNRVGSARHEQVLRQACEQAGVPVLGAIPRTAELELPTRYLGLVTAVEYGRRAQARGRGDDRPGRSPRRSGRRVSRPPEAGSPIRRGILRRRWGRRGGAAAPLSQWPPERRSASAMPSMPSCCGPPAPTWSSSTRSSTRCPTARTRCCCPAAFPNSSPRSSRLTTSSAGQINELAAAGAPVHAECAGLIYLASELDGYPMCGVLAGSARFTPHLTLAYRDAVAVADSPLYSVGQRVVGHEFHRTAVTFTDSYQPAWVYRGDDECDAVRDGVVHAGVHASYLHTHPAAAPDAVARFVAHAAPANVLAASGYRPASTG